MDPNCTFFLFSILGLGTTLTILRDVILVSMEGTPKSMDFMAVRDDQWKGWKPCTAYISGHCLWFSLCCLSTSPSLRMQMPRLC